MRSIGSAVLVVTLAGALGACSAPGSSPSANQPAVRDLQRADEPATPAPAVSDLEAGRPPRPKGPPPIERTLVDQPATTPAPEPAAAEPPAAGPSQVPDAAPAAGAGPQATVPTAPAEDVVELKDRGLPMTLPADGVYGPSLGEMAGGFRPHGPGIMIRGGRGGPDDDCDLDRPGIHGNHGVAINRMTPTPGGSMGPGPSRVGRPHGLRGIR